MPTNVREQRRQERKRKQSTLRFVKKGKDASMKTIASDRGHTIPLHRRPHRQMRTVWQAMARRYRDHDPKWYNEPMPTKRWHESKKSDDESRGR